MLALIPYLFYKCKYKSIIIPDIGEFCVNMVCFAFQGITSAYSWYSFYAITPFTWFPQLQHIQHVLHVLLFQIEWLLSDSQN